MSRALYTLEGRQPAASAAEGKARFAHARASHAEDAMVIIAVDAHGYGEVAQHPESIFSHVDIARDLIMPRWLAGS